jgi:hypothetical protein
LKNNKNENSHSSKVSKMIFDNSSEENMVVLNLFKQILHSEESDDALDLIEWEDDGNGNFIQQ